MGEQQCSPFFSLGVLMKAFWFLLGFSLVLATAANASTPGLAGNEFMYNEQVKALVDQAKAQGSYVGQPEVAILSKTCVDFCSATYFVSVPVSRLDGPNRITSISGTIELPELTSDKSVVTILSAGDLAGCKK
jgi:hypothetical protein